MKDSMKIKKSNITYFNINDYCIPDHPFCLFKPNISEETIKQLNTKGINVSFGYLNLEHKYKIIVALTNEAIDQMYGYEIYDETDGEVKDNMLCLTFYEDTFFYMEEYIFDILNEELDLWITLYEEEYIDTKEKLVKAIEIVQNIVDKTEDKAVIDFGSKLLEFLKIATNLNTIVGFMF